MQALAPLGTDENKPFLEEAPYLIAIFEKKYSFTAEGEKIKHYYTTESVGLAVGTLFWRQVYWPLADLHHFGAGMRYQQYWDRDGQWTLGY